MTGFETVLRVSWQRKLRSFVPFQIPFVPVVLIISLLFALITYYFCSQVYATIVDFETDLKIRISMIMSIFFGITPVIVAILRLNTLHNQSNEMVCSLPISSAVWARVTVKYYLLGQLPVILGLISGNLAATATRSKLPISILLGIALVSLCVTVAFCYASYVAAQYSLLKKGALFQGLLQIMLVILGGSLIFGIYYLSSHKVDFWPKWTGIFGAFYMLLFTGLAFLLNRWIRTYKKMGMDLVVASAYRWPIVFKTKRSSIQKLSLEKLLLITLLRDRRFWMIIVTSLSLCGFIGVLGKMSHDPAFKNFIVSYMPTFMAISVCTAFAELRSTLGADRQSIYNLPISPQRLIVTYSLIAIIVSIMATASISTLLQYTLNENVIVKRVTEAVALGFLTGQATVLSSLIIVESGKDAAKGLGSGILLALFLWPAIAASGVIAKQPTMSILALTGLISVFLIGISGGIESLFLRKERIDG